jgi:hypothetical protein
MVSDPVRERHYVHETVDCATTWWRVTSQPWPKPVWLAFAEGRRKSTVRKPSALSAKLANYFENGCVHSPVRPKGNGGKL